MKIKNLQEDKILDLCESRDQEYQKAVYAAKAKRQNKMAKKQHTVRRVVADYTE